MRIDLVGTTADFRRFGHPQTLPINHLLCENRRTQGRMGEVGLGPTVREQLAWGPCCVDFRDHYVGLPLIRLPHRLSGLRWRSRLTAKNARSEKRKWPEPWFRPSLNREASRLGDVRVRRPSSRALVPETIGDGKRPSETCGDNASRGL